jgi:hypothetical protein
VGDICVIAAVGGFAGAKIFNALETWDNFIADPLGSLLSSSGLTIYGGLIVATFAVLYYTNKNKIPTKHMIDAAAPGLILAYGIGRIGCHLSGDGDWGIVNLAAKPDFISFIPDWAWSSSYPNNVIDEGVLIPGCEGPHCYMLPQPVFPTPLYEVFMAIGLFSILWAIRKRVTIPGILFCIYLIVNGIDINLSEVNKHGGEFSRVIKWFSEELNVSNYEYLTKSSNKTNQLFDRISNFIDLQDDIDWRSINFNEINDRIKGKLQDLIIVRRGTMLKSKNDVFSRITGNKIVTIGKIYECVNSFITSSGELEIQFIDNNGNSRKLPYSDFEDISQRRDDILRDLLD